MLGRTFLECSMHVTVPTGYPYDSHQWIRVDIYCFKADGAVVVENESFSGHPMILSNSLLMGPRQVGGHLVVMATRRRRRWWDKSGG